VNVCVCPAVAAAETIRDAQIIFLISFADFFLSIMAARRRSSFVSTLSVISPDALFVNEMNQKSSSPPAPPGAGRLSLINQVRCEDTASLRAMGGDLADQDIGTFAGKPVHRKNALAAVNRTPERYCVIGVGSRTVPLA
jgi:hypothetical protein